MCSGFGDRYLNDPDFVYKHDEDLVVEEGEMVAPVETPETTECTLLCEPGFVPSPVSSTSCSWNSWSQDPSSLSCVPSPCGIPLAPFNGR